MNDEILTQCDSDLMAEFDPFTFEGNVENEFVEDDTKEYPAYFGGIPADMLDHYITRQADF